MLSFLSTCRRLCQTMAIVLACLAAGCGQQSDLQISHKFQQAEERFAEAKTPEQYKQVAALYQEILDAGFDSGIVYYNQGNAWMRAGQHGRAIAAYRQAQRQLPRDPYLSANLNRARQLGGHSGDGAVPLLNHIFFWQQALSYREKSILFTALLAVMLLVACLRQFKTYHGISRNLTIVGIIPILLIGVSIIRDWSDQENTIHGVVIEEVIARKGRSTSYDSAFKQPLDDGIEFVLLGTEADWLHIQVANDATAWIPSRAAVTY